MTGCGCGISTGVARPRVCCWGEKKGCRRKREHDGDDDAGRVLAAMELTSATEDGACLVIIAVVWEVVVCWLVE